MDHLSKWQYMMNIAVNAAGKSRIEKVVRDLRYGYMVITSFLNGLKGGGANVE